ncbi:hypothetical protein [Amycolatopsis dongchuanensis]|uniref:Transmembrane protein n=1 Tax=Amycolatopsis dongchuanensis TaxID=1070866 RepID=A0ABP9QUS3_9PSEU
MKLYAELPVRRTTQAVSDLVAVLLTVLAVWLGLTVHDEVLRLQAPGTGLVDAGSSLARTFDSAADHADDVPLVGGALAGALHSGSAAGTKLADPGQWQIDAVGQLAFWLAAALISVPVLFLLVTWLPLRWRFARRATAGVRLRALGDEGRDLLALRALTGQGLPRLAAAGDVTSGWRDRDPEVLARLAGWELARLGLRG